MRCYNQPHQFYCGVDLHARSLYAHVLDAKGQTVLDRDLPASPAAFLDAVQPFRDGLVVGAECMFAWYWLADLCEGERIPFVLGHALYMKMIHGGKAKNDRIDAAKLAGMLRGGLFPMAYVYPKAKRQTRDLLRRRSFFVRNSSPTSSTPTVSSTCRPCRRSSAMPPTAPTASPSASNTRAPSSPSPPTWPSSTATTNRSPNWNGTW